MTLRGHAGNSISSVCFLDHDLLASCESKNGTLLLWDVSKRKVVHNLSCSGIAEESVGRGGLSISKCVEEDGALNRFIYQRRSEISLYDMQTMEVIHSIKTGTLGFCKAVSKCNLVFYPVNDTCDGRHSAFFKVWDLRCDPNTKVMKLSAVSARGNDEVNYGMLNSLGVIRNTNDFVVACGMESGDILYHSLSYGNSSAPSQTLSPSCCLSVGREPVLCLDLTKSEETENSIVGVAGMASMNPDELDSKNNGDSGTIITFKIKPASAGLMSAKVRKRLSTCPVNNESLMAKTGVACCKFENNGRMFAVGCWDNRARVFSRSGKLLSVMKGHKQSINCLDWKPHVTDRKSSSILATGGAEGHISLWKIPP